MKKHNKLPMPDDAYYTDDEAAAALGITVEELHVLGETGELSVFQEQADGSWIEHPSNKRASLQ